MAYRRRRRRSLLVPVLPQHTGGGSVKGFFKELRDPLPRYETSWKPSGTAKGGTLGRPQKGPKSVTKKAPRHVKKPGAIVMGFTPNAPKGRYRVRPSHKKANDAMVKGDVKASAKEAQKAAMQNKGAYRTHTDTAKNGAANLLTDTAVRVAADLIAEAIRNTASPTSHSGDKVPATNKDTEISLKSMAGAGVHRYEYRKSFESGYPATKAVKQYAKLHGTRKKVLYDTKIAAAGLSGSQMAREDLNGSCGFNSRNFRIFSANCYVNHEDCRDTAAITTSDFSILAYESLRAYASIMWIKTQIAVYNQSAYFPMKAKIYMITHKDPKFGTTIQQDFAQNVFNAVTSTQTNGAVPIWYQHANPVIEGAYASGNCNVSIDMSLKGRGLMDSGHFRANYDIVKTFTQKIEPNSTWFFNHKHHCGPGLDIARLIEESASTANLLSPAGYFYVLEVSGYPCEAIAQEGVLQFPYLGTNPCYYQTEYKKTLKYGLQALDGTDITSSGIGSSNCAVRVYTTQDAVSATGIREKYVLPANLVDDPASLADGKAVVPFLTDKVPAYEKTTSGGHAL